MDTLTAISSYRTRQQMADDLDSKGRRRNSDRTAVADVALRDVAARQGAALRGALATGRQTPTQARIGAAVAAVRATQNAPAPVARPAVASVNPDRPTFQQINDLSKTIPTGFYALPRRGDAPAGGQPAYHFKIHKFRGGHRIVMITGGVGAFVEIPMKTGWQWIALQKIAADPKAAAVLFGQETGTCGRCGSPLTNDASRKAGVGPKCASKL